MKSKPWGDEYVAGRDVRNDCDEKRGNMQFPSIDLWLSAQAEILEIQWDMKTLPNFNS